MSPQLRSLGTRSILQPHVHSSRQSSDKCRPASTRSHFGLPGRANPPAVLNHAMAEVDPFVLRQQLASGPARSSSASVVLRQAEPLAEPRDVRVDDHARWRCRRPCRARRWPSCGRRPGSSTSCSMSRGTSPSCFSTSSRQQALMFLALLRKKPVLWIVLFQLRSGARGQSRPAVG